MANPGAKSKYAQKLAYRKATIGGWPLPCSMMITVYDDNPKPSDEERSESK